MGFSSFPIFLDPPNWSQMQQQPLQCLMSGGGSDHHHHLIPPPSSNHHQQQQLAPLPCNNNNPNTNTATSGPPPSSLHQQQAQSGDPAAQAPLDQAQAPAAAPASVTSMTERARLARVPLPEPGTLRCPRCDSANTKFCYFNNYSLSQPRHFCKACRRYWTRGGALRNVPVGGGCRRNTKRSNSKKSSRSNSQSQSHSQATSSATSSCSTTTATSASTTSAAMQALPHHVGLQLDASLDGYHHHNQLQFLPAFMQQQQQGMMMHGGHGGGYGHFADGAASDMGSAGHQLPDGFPRGMVASGLLAQLASIKMEEHGAVANGAAGGIVGGGGFQLGLGAHEQYWPGSGGGGGLPTEFLSGFSSSSSGNVL